MALKDLLKKATEAKEKVKKAAGEAVEHGARKLGVEEQLEQATKAAGEVAKNVSEAAKFTTERVAEAAGKAAERGAEKLKSRRNKIPVENISLPESEEILAGHAPKEDIPPTTEETATTYPTGETQAIEESLQPIVEQARTIPQSTVIRTTAPAHSQAPTKETETTVKTPATNAGSAVSNGAVSQQQEKESPSLSNPNQSKSETPANEVPLVEQRQPTYESTDTVSKVSQLRDKKIRYSYALTFPFHQKKWALGLSWPALIGVFIPFLNLVFLYGWAVDIVRRMAREDARLLPELRDVGRFFANGIILWVMLIIYSLPSIVASEIFGLDLIQIAQDIILWCYNSFIAHNETQSLAALLSGILFSFLAEKIIPVLLGIVLVPAYCGGLIRFALTRRASTFFNIPANFGLVARHLPDFMLASFYLIITVSLFTFVGGLLTVTGVGVLLALILLSMFFWTIGGICGQLAAKVEFKGK